MTEFWSYSLQRLVHTAGEVASTVVAANAEREDAEASWPAPAIRALGETGLLGLNAPRSLGGHGEGLLALAAVAEVLAGESPSTALCFGMHCVGTAVLAAKATDYHRARYLEPIARGEHITTIALSEPGTGAHFHLPESSLHRDGDSLVITGTKSFVTSGGHADSYIVSTVSVDEGSGGGGGTFSCVAIDAGTPGLRWDAPWQGFGMRANSSRNLRLEGVRVPAAHLLGQEGDQLWYLFEVVAPYFLVAMAGTYVGLARAAVELARTHLRTRRYSHSGELLGANEVLSHRLGALWIAVEATRRLVFSAAARADAEDPDALVAILGAKAAAADAAVTAANEAMTLSGGAAYGQNSKLARLLRDARAAHVMAPTTDMLKTWVGRALLQLPLL